MAETAPRVQTQGMTNDPPVRPEYSMVDLDLDSEEQAVSIAQKIATQLQKVITIRTADGSRLIRVEPAKRSIH